MTIEEYIEEEIKNSASPVDVEFLYDDMLDESYSFNGVGGPFQHMQPSSVLREVDPTAYRCGYLDFYDNLSRDDNYIEIDEQLYDDVAMQIKDDLERALHNIEVFEVTKEEFFNPDHGSWMEERMRDAMKSYDDDMDDEEESNARTIEAEGLAGFYYWYSCPGCMPDSDAMGPFGSVKACYEDATRDV